MSAQDYQLVVAALPRLTAEERSRVMQRLAALGAMSGQSTVAVTGGGRQPNSDDDIAFVLGSIVRVVLRAAGERVTVAALRRTQQSRGFGEKAAALREFVAHAAAERVQQAALLDLGFGLLHESLCAGGYSTSARALMSHAHRIPSVINKAFPGYAASGLLSMIVRK